MFSSAFFWHFFHGIVCLSSSVFPRAFLVFFLGRLGRRCCPIHMCWPVCPWLFKFFSMPTTLPKFNSLLVDLFSAPPMSAPPSSGYSVAI